jgi:hypothetical protein
MEEAGQRAFPFQSVFTVHAGIEMSAKIFELLLAEVVLQIAQQVDVDVITGLHKIRSAPAILSTRSNTSNKEIFPNVRKASPIR